MSGETHSLKPPSLAGHRGNLTICVSYFTTGGPGEEHRTNKPPPTKITADGDCSHEIKRRLLLRRKVMTNLGSILKSRNINLPAKVCLVKTMVFPVVTYGCESWTVRKLSTEKLMLLNCGIGEDSWESLGLQGDLTSPS